MTAAGSGDVSITSGGQITITAAANTPSAGVRIAEGSGATGTITVVGSGSNVTSQGGQGYVLVGGYGDGDIYVANGGQLNGFSFNVGRSQGSDGELRVSGFGARILASNAYGDFSATPQYAGGAGNIQLGGEAGSDGLLFIRSGGRVDVLNDPATNYDNPVVRIARDYGSVGRLVVSGYFDNASYTYASTLRIEQTGPLGDFVATDGVGPNGPQLIIGDRGAGTAQVDNGAEIVVTGAGANLTVGYGQKDGAANPYTGSQFSNLLIVSGASVLVDSQNYGGQQTFTDGSGNPVQANLGASVVVGNGLRNDGVISIGSGSLTVQSSFTGAGDYQNGGITVGNQGGNGNLTISTGGVVNARGLQVGNGTGSIGQTFVYDGAVATITGTSATPYQGIRIGEDGGAGSINVNNGSKLTSEGGAGFFQIGNQATGQLNVRSSGDVYGFFMEIGSGAGSDGGLLVNGFGSSVYLSDYYGAFAPTTGQLGALLRVGAGNGGDGMVLVNDAGRLIISNAEDTPANQTDGAALEIGSDVGSTGFVVVSGDYGEGGRSRLLISNTGRSNDNYMPGEYYGPEIRLGVNGGDGQLLIEQGGLITVVGERAQVVIGQGTENGDFNAEPTSLFSVTSGGDLIVDSRPDSELSNSYYASADIVIGEETGGNGRLLVQNAGSVVRIYSDNEADYYANGDLSQGAGLEVGKLGRGVLDVFDGGRIIINGADDAFPHLTIGYGMDGATISASGYVEVSGGGSLIQIYGTSTEAGANLSYGAGGTIDVGTHDGSYGRLIISDGGQVYNSSINSKTQIAKNAGSTGLVYVAGSATILSSGDLLTVGADINLETGAFIDDQSGDGTLTIYDQAYVFAGSTFVGSTGQLNIDNATLSSNVEVTGDFQIAGDNIGIGSARVAGALTVTTGTLEFDVSGVGTGVNADFLTASSAIFSGSAITVDVSNASLLNVGDNAPLFATQGSLFIDSLETVNFVGGTANAGQKFTVSLFSATLGQTVNTNLVFSVQQVTLADFGGDGMATVANGGQVALTSVDLSVLETGVTPENTIFTASNIVGGQLEFATAPGVAITTFTQADVNARAVRFVDDDMVTDGSFDVSYTDSAAFTETVSFSVIEGVLNPLAVLNVGDLDGTNGITLNGIIAGDQTGLGVSDVGDINGDGIDDIAVGASFADTPAGTDSGEAYIIFGVDGGLSSPFELSSLDGTNGFTFTGLGASQLTGINGSIEGVGDVNNDDIDDFIVGIGGVDSGGVFNVGEAFLIYGNSSGFGADFDLGNLNGENGTRIVGIDFNSLTGQLVPGLGDVNGDGINDIGISATFGDGAAGTDSGESFVVFGADGGLGATLMLSSLDGTNGFRLEGETAGDNSGTIGRVGDFNNDGIDDFLVGSPNDDNANGANTGNVQIIFGTTAPQSAVRQLGSFTPSEGFRILGLAANDSLGSSVSDAGDLNGDGIDDLIITAKTADVGGVVDAGTTYVIFGTSDDLGGSFDLATLDGTNGFSVSGSVSIQRAGYTSASAGDVNGDGIEDLIIGSVRGAPGEAYVIFGSTAPFAATFDLNTLDGSNGFQITGSSVDGVLGRDVSTAGDFNNDGIDDILVGSNTADPGGRINAGEAYVIYGVAGAGIIPPVIDGDFFANTEADGTVLLTSADINATGGAPADLLYHVTSTFGGVYS